MKIGKIIKKHRERAGMTQLELAKALGYDIPQFISLVENGHSKLPLEICKSLLSILKIERVVLEGALMAEYKNKLKSYL